MMGTFVITLPIIILAYFAMRLRWRRQW